MAPFHNHQPVSARITANSYVDDVGARKNAGETVGLPPNSGGSTPAATRSREVVRIVAACLSTQSKSRRRMRMFSCT